MTTATLRALKGAPLSVLVGLALARSTTGVADLSHATGYSQKSVGQALQVLSVMGLAQNSNRYAGWALTARAYQLPLWPTYVDGETYNLRLPPSSSSSRESHEIPGIMLESPESCESNLLPLQARETYNLRLPPETVDNLVDCLTRRAYCSRRRARQAIAQSGLSAEEIEMLILEWSLWVASDHGAGIQNPGYLIAARIADGEYTPNWFQPDGYDSDTLRWRQLAVRAGRIEPRYNQEWAYLDDEERNVDHESVLG